MARRHKTGSEKKKRADRKADKKHDDDKKKAKKQSGNTTPGTVTEDIKAQSTQSGDAAMNAVPNSYPADPANADAVFTTGPGQAVEYNYIRVDGGSGNYAPLQSSFTAPVAGHGQILTPAAAGETPATGSENNPT